VKRRERESSKQKEMLTQGRVQEKTEHAARCQWLTPIILANQEVEIRKNTVQSQPRQIVCKTLSRKDSSEKGW
jgi:hypothetical protein